MLADFWICVIFMLDWGASLATAPSKGEFLRKRWIDLIASIPFVEGLRFLRIVRAVRIIRLFRFLRGVRGLAHLLRLIAGNRTRSLFTIYISCTAVILAYCSLGFYTFETSINKNIASYGDALWLAFTTLTTVGYGDVYPVTSSGRFIAVALVITGLGLFSLMTAEFATIFMRYAKEDKNRNSKREE
jgi:voltage-gated potassium channel